MKSIKYRLSLILLGVLASGSASAFNLALDIGHLPDRPGAISARGKPEYLFNKEMAQVIYDRIHQHPDLTAFIVNPEGKEMALKQRPVEAANQGSDFLISIHHDSVQPQYLSKWTHQGRNLYFTDKFRGFSLFVSKKNPHFADSFAFAKLLGDEFLAVGMVPTLHHAEKIKGENRTLLDATRGIYQFDDLVVLKSSSIPALLLECGVILNPDEEILLESDDYRQKISQAILNATLAYREMKSSQVIESTGLLD